MTPSQGSPLEKGKGDHHNTENDNGDTMVLKMPILAGGLLAALLGIGSTAHAQSNVQLYGLVDAWTGVHKPVGGNKREGTVGGGGMTTSYWGLKGQEELSNGVRAVFAMEGFFRPETGQAGRFNGDPMFSRSAYVGLQSDDAGTLTLGRLTTPYFVSTILFNPFGDSYTFSPAVFHTYLGMEGQGVLGDSGWSNAVKYTTPDFNGLTANLIYGFSNEANKSGSNKWGGNALYFNGAFSATLAYQQVKFDNQADDLDNIVAGFRHQRATQLGMAYDFDFAKVFAQFQYVKNTITSGDITMKGGQFGVSVPMGGGKVLASYGHTRSSGASEVKRNSWALGYDYELSKRTDVYAAYYSDKLTDLSRGDTFGVGIRTRF